MSRRSRRARATSPASPRSSSATIPRPRSTWAASRRPRPRWASGPSTTGSPATSPQQEVEDLIAQLNADPAVSGILCQLPVPDHMDGVHLTGLIDAAKDVDGLTAVSAGLLALGRPGLRPCTPSGVMTLLADAGAELEGAEAVVIGRSNLFGKPMAQLLLGANATVTTCHSRTRDLAGVGVARRRPDRRRGAGRDGAARLGQAGRRRHRRRDQPHRRRPGGRRRVRRGRRGRARRSPRSREAWDR